MEKAIIQRPMGHSKQLVLQEEDLASLLRLFAPYAAANPAARIR
jgi:hypothetical protein